MASTTSTKKPAKPTLCPIHTKHRAGWENHRYDWRNPKDWPGQTLMDSRTAHATREAEWNRKNAEQVEMTERICLSGTSPQCDWKPLDRKDITPPAVADLAPNETRISVYSKPDDLGRVSFCAFWIGTDHLTYGTVRGQVFHTTLPTFVANCWMESPAGPAHTVTAADDYTASLLARVTT